MKQVWFVMFLLFSQMGMGWVFFTEYSHTMSALGKDNLFRTGIITPFIAGFGLSGYGEVNLFLGIPIQSTNALSPGTTRGFVYSAIGLDVVYREMRFEEIFPYGRFGVCVVWPHPEMTESSQAFGVRGGVGMVFVPFKSLGFSLGIDFTGLIQGGRAARIVTRPVYHEGVQVVGGLFWRL